MRGTAPPLKGPSTHDGKRFTRSHFLPVYKATRIMLNTSYAKVREIGLDLKTFTASFHGQNVPSPTSVQGAALEQAGRPHTVAGLRDGQPPAALRQTQEERLRDGVVGRRRLVQRRPRYGVQVVSRPLLLRRRGAGAYTRPLFGSTSALSVG